MTRLPPKARGLVIGTLTAGTTVLAAAAFKAAGAPHATLALLGAAVVLTELIQIQHDERSPDPGDAHSLSFSSGVHIAAVLLVGPWAAALVAAFGVVVVDLLRGSPRLKVAYNASAFAISILAGGLAFEALGGVPGNHLQFSSDFAAIGALVVVAYILNTLFMSAIVAFNDGASLGPLTRAAGIDGLQSAAAEAGLGVAVAWFGVHDPWAIVVLVPLALAVYQSYARLATLRRETVRALETFANMVDERDNSTFRHSARVADYVEELAEALGFPSTEVARLRWAGRLHDLGKISVDASVLRKPAKLDEDEWQAMRRHPRLSARLLRRFRFAAGESRAVEYHHERADGRGYYGIDPGDIPLMAHFLIVADSYDAMTSDRAYRLGLSNEQALAEIEGNLGTQFHPIVGKAFLALRRGENVAAALTDKERLELRGLLSSTRRPVLRRRELPTEYIAAGGVIGALVALGAGFPLLAVPAVLLAAAGLALLRVSDHRKRRLVRGLTAVLDGERARDATFSQLAAVIAGACDLRWAGLVGWRERECTGSIELEWHGGSIAPSETSLTSWLLREAETADGLPVAQGAELGREDLHIAVPLYDGEVVGGYVVLAVGGRLPLSVCQALRSCAAAMAADFMRGDPSAVAQLPLTAAVG